MGDDAKMLSLVTSANVACGGHASDPETMFKTLELARDRGVSVGAHPGFNDREGFGRRVIPMTPAEVTRMVAAQVGALQSLAALAGTTVDYVKAHGALANHAAAHREFADAVVAGIGGLPILAISGTQLEVAGKAAGIDTYSEIFADRGYQPNGQLVPRGLSEAANAEVVNFDRAVAAKPPDGLLEVVPAMVNALVIFDPLLTDHTAVEAALRGVFPLAGAAAAQATRHDISVCFDPGYERDLDAVAAQTGLDREAVIAAHLSGDYSASMYGFAPGYAYLSGVPEAIQIPRKTAPVRDIPVGAVMIAGGQCLITTLECRDGAVSFVVAGGDFSVTCGGADLTSWQVHTLHAGEKLVIRGGASGSWCYLDAA